MQIQENISLQPYNTFHLSATAAYYASFQSVGELQELASQALTKNKQPYLLGGGSNILLTQAHIDGWILHNHIQGIEVLQEDSDYVYLKAGAGCSWHELVMLAVDQGWQGIENLALIPGTCGAAPIQNIGAYGVELKDVLVSVDALQWMDLQIHHFTAADCRLGYRNSIFKQEARHQYAITHITILLRKKPIFRTDYGAIQQELKRMQVERPTVKAIAEAVMQIRRSKLPDPAMMGNAGSFFKNPEILADEFDALQEKFPEIPHYPGNQGGVKLAAGWLIEQTGWKGYRRGDAGCHAQQALVLVNYGQASGAELLALSEEIQASVLAHFGIKLEREVNTWPIT
jgi:UDP-N-acetylmuramate dehydrogenase